MNVWLEAGIYCGLLVWLARQRPLLNLLRAVSAPYRILLGTLVVALPAGQMVGRNQWTYPWVGWAMYTGSIPGDVVYLDYTVVLASGEESDWPVARLFSRIGKKVAWKLRTFDQDGAIDAHDRMLVALAERYNRAHAENAVQTIRVWRCVVPMDEYHGRGSVRREFQREVGVN